MELRSSLSVAVLLGTMLGLGTAQLERNAAAAAATAAATGPLPTPVAHPEVTRWDIPVVWNEPVMRLVDILDGQQDRMALYLKRSGRYEGMIRSKLRERGMPEDLLYLSMIESGFNPTALSKARAVGLWQFMAETGRRYGLRIDPYVDERRNPERSTDAALTYLQDLHERFGSWNLAAAAYNTGENRVGRIMREMTGAERGRETDFWVIRSRLPRETRDYVPLMFAAALIGKEPHKYGLEDVERYLPVRTDTVWVGGRTELASVARAAGLPTRDLAVLNPELVRGITPPREQYPVRVPEGLADRVQARLGPRVRIAE